MLQQQLQRKQKNFALQRGLYVVRYEAAVDPTQPPTVTLVCEPGRNEVIFHPDQGRATMSAPGQSLVVRANETANLQVEISSTAGAATLDATLKFEPLRGDTSMPAGAVSVPAGRATVGGLPPLPAPPVVPEPTAIKLLGHVARIGDVTVGAEEWIAGPAAPARVEGFLVRWPNHPQDVTLRYSANVAGQRASESSVVQVDDYVGTRGRGRALLGLMMELTGAGARNYSLNVEALFLGAPMRRGTGQSVSLTGPTGREPLVGLRVSVSAIAAPRVQQPLTAAPVPQYQAPPARSPVAAAAAASSSPSMAASGDGERRRVRVFRG